MTEDWAVLFDFGNTLADETWMTTDLGVFPDWPDVYRRVVGPLGTDWGLGRLSSVDIAGRLAQVFGCDIQPVYDHMIELYRHIQFYPHIMGAVRRRRGRRARQALVTVNPADLADMLALHGVPELFDLVVCSGQEGLGNKSRLAVLAAERLRVPLAQVVLVDNIEANVEGFRARGERLPLQGGRAVRRGCTSSANPRLQAH